MTGDEYLVLAGRLVASTAFGTAEARFRTAASRATTAPFISRSRC